MPFGGTTPGRVGHLSAGLKPYAWLSAQISASREKKDSAYYRYQPGTAIERRNLQCRIAPWRPLALQGRRRELIELTTGGYRAARHDALAEYSGHGLRVRLKYSALDSSSGRVAHLYGGECRYRYQYFSINGAWYALLPGEGTPLAGPLVTGNCLEPCQQAMLGIALDTEHCRAALAVRARTADGQSFAGGFDNGRIEGNARLLW